VQTEQSKVTFGFLRFTLRYGRDRSGRDRR
jgi:RNA-directed DNA polymerase